MLSVSCDSPCRVSHWTGGLELDAHTMSTATQLNLAMINLMGGYLLGDYVPSDMRARFAIAVMYGYFLGGKIFHEWILAFATVMAVYGGMAIRQKYLRDIDPSGRHR